LLVAHGDAGVPPGIVPFTLFRIDQNVFCLKIKIERFRAFNGFGHFNVGKVSGLSQFSPLPLKIMLDSKVI